MTLSHSFDDRDTCVQCGASRFALAGVNCPKGFLEDATAERVQLNGEVRAWKGRCQRLGDRVTSLEQRISNMQRRDEQLQKALGVERGISFVGWIRRRWRLRSKRR